VDISWYGLSCFRISERGQITVVTDPFSDAIGLRAPQLKADVVTVSHDEPGHNNVEVVKGPPYILTGPGEYEVGGVFIMGLALHNVKEETPRRNVGYAIEYENLTVLHLGDLDHVPEQSVIEEIGEVNVLLVPVGGGAGLKANEAAEVVSLIEPHYVVPMHYAQDGLALELDPVERFLRAMGVTSPQETDMLRVNAASLPEQPQVVILTPQTT
jgi:L-ascorbate metabolism protein UlaG (beta-lactamase superfamily)